MPSIVKKTVSNCFSSKGKIISRYVKLSIVSVSLLALQCGPQKGGERKVLVATEMKTEKPGEEESVDEVSETSSRPPEDLFELIQKDELRSADIIRESLKKKDDPTLAAWAAVYALRLGIEHDEKLSKRAIEGVSRLDDPLLVALCWRWLAEKGDYRLPGKPKVNGKDPVIKALAALAVASRRPLKKDLNRALGLPNIDLPKGGVDRRMEAKERVEELLSVTAPYDDGPLALTVVFVEARRQEWTETDEHGKSHWVSERLRKELVGVVLGDNDKAFGRIEKSKPVLDNGFTHLGGELESSLLSHTRDMLHSIAVTGEPDLQIDALNAISVLAFEPTVADFGAAAAVLDSEDPAVRLAGAHTFLFLSTRARSR